MLSEETIRKELDKLKAVKEDTKYLRTEQIIRIYTYINALEWVLLEEE